MKFSFTINHIYLLFGITVVSMLLLNISMNQHLQEEEPQVVLPSSVPQQVLKEEQKVLTKKTKRATYVHTPANPKDFGLITLKKDATRPRTPEQWELHYRNLFRKRQLFKEEGAQEALAFAQTRPEQYEDSLTKLNEKIEETQKAFAQDPLNNKLEQSLQTMYKLKALGRILKTKVLAESNDPFVENLYQQIPKK